MIILIISIDFVECLYWSFLEKNKVKTFITSDRGFSKIFEL